MHVWNVLHAPPRGSLKIRDAKSYGTKKSPSVHRTNCWAIASQLRYVSTVEKKNVLNSHISFTCFHNMVNVDPLTAEIGWWVWGTPANFNGFASWLRYCSDVAQWRSTKLCTIFGRLLGWCITVFPQIQAGPRIQAGGPGLHTDRVWQVCTVCASLVCVTKLSIGLFWLPYFRLPIWTYH